MSETLIKKFIILALPFSKYLPALITGDNIFAKFRETFTKWTNKVIETTSNTTEKTIPSLINLLVHAKDEETNTSLTYQQIVDNVKIFYLAGHETTSSLVTVTFYQLLRHPEIIKKFKMNLIWFWGMTKKLQLSILKN